MNSKINRMLNKIIDKKIKSIEKDFLDAANETVKIMGKEAEKMFDKYIDDYYKFETHAYIRHGQQRPGTKTGENLYRAQNIKYETGKHPKLTISINANDMIDKKYIDDKEDVLDNILNGNRGREPYWYKPWEGSYDGLFYSYNNTDTGNMKESFNAFVEDVEDYFIKAIHKRGW